MTVFLQQFIFFSISRPKNSKRFTGSSGRRVLLILKSVGSKKNVIPAMVWAGT
jgi:hypothetical protein